jgi:hypothetical protein
MKWIKVAMVGFGGGGGGGGGRAGGGGGKTNKGHINTHQPQAKKLNQH